MIVAVFCCAVYAAPLQAQPKPAFTLTCDAKQIVENGYFEITYTLSNAKASNFDLPAFRDFNVKSGPNRSTSVSIVNGNVTNTAAFSYILRPKRIGKFKIPATTIKANGKTMTSNSLTIEVVKAKELTPGEKEAQDERLFIKAIPNTYEGHIGQQILLDYKLYTKVGIDNYNLISESEYPGFYSDHVVNYGGRMIREVVDGVQYSTKTLKRVALFPQQSGALKISPITMELGIVNKKNDRFFPIRFPELVTVESEPITINVSELPEPKPDDFGGGVGSFNMDVRVDNLAISTDDALSIKAKIYGNGDIKRVQPPKLVFSDSFDIYDPRVLDEKAFERNGEEYGEKTFEFLAVPQKKGTYTLQTTFSYFNPDSAMYVQLQAKPLTIHVKQGSANGNVLPPDFEKDRKKEDIRFIKTETNLRKQSTRFADTPFFWTLLGLPFLFLLGAMLYKRRQAALDNIDPETRRRNRAKKVALQYFTESKNHLAQNDSRGFYDSVSRALLGYISNKLSIPNSELTKDNVREKMTALNIPDTDVKTCMDLLHRCEMALYAGQDNREAMQATYTDGVDWVSRVEM